jgi:hypothetical protein
VKWRHFYDLVSTTLHLLREVPRDDSMRVSWHNPISSPGEITGYQCHFSRSLSCLRYVPPSTSFSPMYLDNMFVHRATTFLRLLLFVTAGATYIISLLPILNILWMPGHLTRLFFSRSRSSRRLNGFYASHGTRNLFLSPHGLHSCRPL